MIWRFLAVLRRLVRDLRQPPELSQTWRAQQQYTESIQGWDREVRWHAHNLDPETWKGWK